MAKLRALIFDVDGTLAETEEAHRAAFNMTFADWNLGWNWSADDYRQLLATAGGKERLHTFQTTFHDVFPRLSDDQISELHRQKTANYSRILSNGDLTLRPGVADLIARARDKGLAVAVATTTNAPNVDALCQCCWGRAADQVFDVIAAGDQVTAKKPAPDVFELALARLGMPPDAAVAFEDSRNGVLSAKAAGLWVLVTPSAYTDTDDFTDADWIAPTLRHADLPPVLAAI